MAVETTREHQPDIVNLVREITWGLVDKPSNVLVQAVHGVGSTTVRLSVNAADIGKVIGKQGRTAHSLRVILGAIGMKYGHKFFLEIVDQDSPDQSHAATTPSN